MNLPGRVTSTSPVTPELAERVLSRALDLREATRRDALTVGDIVEMADELGIPQGDLARAVVVETLEPAVPPGGWAVRLAGPPTATATRVWPAPHAVVAPLLESWLGRGHGMEPHHGAGDAVVWTPLGGLAGRVRRAALAASGGGALADTAGVRVRCIEFGALCGVRMEADVGSPVVASVAATGLAAAGLVAAGALAVAVAPVLIVTAPVGAALGAAVLVHRRRRVAEATVELERVCDAVQRGERPRGAIGGFVARIAGR